MGTPNKIDSNIVGLAFAEEASLKTLPGSPIWRELEPNSYNDFGGDLKTVSRSPINASRQRQKGTVTDLDAKGGFNQDLTQGNLLRLLQGFMFADAHEKPDTASMNGTAVTIIGVYSTGNMGFECTGGSVLDVFKANHLIMASGFGVAGNNGLKVVSGTATGYIQIAAGLTAEAAPPAAARLQVVGFQFPSGGLVATASAGNLRLASSTVDLTTLELNVGEWVFIGGDTSETKFATCPVGYARIKTIAAGYIDFDRTTFVAASDAGTGKTVRMFFGTVVRNEKNPSLIKRRSYQLERQLGSDDTTDASKIQTEYLVGAIPNGLKLTIPQAGKASVDLSFEGMDVEFRSGTTGKKPGNRVNAAVEDAFNTSNDLYRARIAVLDATNTNAAGLFGYVSEMSLEIKNNVSGNKALGVLGSFDASAGNFEVDGSATAYFSTIAANSSIRVNADIELNLIMAQKNAGLVFDLPLISLSGGKLTVDKDKPVMVPLKSEAAECAAGYTMLHVNFPYLPNAAMPV